MILNEISDNEIIFTKLSSQRNGKEWVHKKYLTAPNAYNIIRSKIKYENIFRKMITLFSYYMIFVVL